ncbi:hypothetical protein [Streptomyces sp. NPDC090025]|uniref:hypothetical protein n=1 Tax=Streptomyces sp. NPDC090025 TaxID=3365922 RepID=UPI0038371C93
MQPSDYIAVLAIVISFAASWLAYRASMKSHQTATKSHETSSYHAGTDLFMQLNLVFVEYPHVRPYFYDGKVLEPHDPNRDRVHAVAELMLDVFEWIWHRREGISEVDRQAWADYVGSMFALSPVLRAYHLDHLAWHPTITDLYFSQGEFAGTRLPGQQQTSPEGA